MNVKLPTLAATGVSTAVAYHFKCTNGMGWAICTINDATGELSVQSDWGTWAYRWNVRALGESTTREGCQVTLEEFIGARDPYGDPPHYGPSNYLADKLMPRDQRQEFSEDKTVDEILRRIIERRREEFIGADDARELYDAAKALRSETDLRDFVNRADEDAELPQWAFDRCEDIRYAPTHVYFILRDVIIPALILAVRERLAKKSAA